jgi:hypothetical protein
MANTISVVPRLDDKTVLSIFLDINTKFQTNGSYLNVAGLDQIDLRALDAQTKRLIKHLDRAGSYLISNVSANFQNFNVHYYRSGAEQGRPRPYNDEFRVDHNDNAGGLEPLIRLEVLEFINQRVTLAPASEPPQNDASTPAQDIEGIYRSTVLKLETSFAQQIEKITDWTVDQTTALEQTKLKLADETAAERESLRKEHEARLEGLRQEADSLDARRKELDDRDYMHARRGIRNDLRELIKNREQKFSLTSNTRRLRLPVHATMIFLLVGLLAVNGVYLGQIASLDIASSSIQVLLWAFSKQSIAAIVFIATLLFYVRWMNRWFEQHAAAEFLLKQFELDIDRASWVVETAMEWRRDQKSEIPGTLLEGITRNLFADAGGGSAEKHTAADDLASALVGNASQVKLKLGENEVSFDRKALAELGKAESP